MGWDTTEKRRNPRAWPIPRAHRNAKPSPPGLPSVRARAGLASAASRDSASAAACSGGRDPARRFSPAARYTMEGAGRDANPLIGYRIRITLGFGSFGKVKIAEHILTGHEVAIKIINRRRITSMEMEEKVKRDLKILRLLMHPHIIRLYEVIDTPADIYVVMEYCKKGELFDYIIEKGRLHEQEACRFFQQMVVNRDLRLESILLDSRCNVKIADFSSSAVMRDGHFLKTSCGSTNYAAPEIISGKLYAGPEVDVWSCGVILYALLCGTLPFDDENIPNLFKKIEGGIYTLPSHLSPSARDLIPRMLVVDPMRRITIREIREHVWFNIQLSRYLAVPPPDTAQQVKKLNEETLNDVLNMGFDKNQLIESLQNRLQNEATVAYYLLLDDRLRTTSVYLGSDFQESMREHLDALLCLAFSFGSASMPRSALFGWFASRYTVWLFASSAFSRIFVANPSDLKPLCAAGKPGLAERGEANLSIM
ncbi:unnamed protein product [Miscanthus lutarioriparius]|uniref:Non-specific serine/threonine protein kinase n=1 Tax=Miscanthus lutarioriparius TaxID=422564 RepID=A0A811RLX4_9POAL|nr:unnamed protein product [Miscanthus lutarioriparius]